MVFRVVTSAALVGVVAGGACTREEEAALNNPQKVAEAAQKCRNIIIGLDFNDCFAQELGLSKACAGCYAVAEEYSAENCKAECLLGFCKAGCLACNAPAQEDLATCTGFTQPATDPCEEILMEEAEETACTTDEQTTLVNSYTAGATSFRCSSASSDLYHNLNHDKFNDCFTEEYGVSRACAECYAVAEEYTYKNCNAECILGFCNPACLSCNAPAEDDLIKCAGVDARKYDPCEETLKDEAKGGACTSEDEAALNDPQKVAEAAQKCWNVVLGGFDNDCFAKELGLSKACAGCYAVAEEYSAQHCQADCLLGFCKASCLACNAPAQEDLATCTGFTPPATDPCEEILTEEVEETACTTDEQTTLVNSYTAGATSFRCADKSLDLHHDLNHDKFNDCFTEEFGVSRACAECYAVAEEYAEKNCKAECLLGFCNPACLSCNAPAEDDLVKCAGVDARKYDPCEEIATV